MKGKFVELAPPKGNIKTNLEGLIEFIKAYEPGKSTGTFTTGIFSTGSSVLLFSKPDQQLGSEKISLSGEASEETSIADSAESA